MTIWTTIPLQPVVIIHIGETDVNIRVEHSHLHCEIELRRKKDVPAHVRAERDACGKWSNVEESLITPWTVLFS